MSDRCAIFVDIVPTQPWPPADEARVYPPAITQDTPIQIYSQPNGTFRIQGFGEHGGFRLTTCPITFTGTGAFRMTVAWKDSEAVVLAEGACIASSDYNAPAVEGSTTISLKEELPPAEALGAAWEWAHSPHRSPGEAL